MTKQRISLIPRYNWDYNFSDYAKALAAAFKPTLDGTEVFRAMFGQVPIFTTSGRTSLYAILKCLALPEKSRVGVPLFCCPVVFDAIRQAGLVPTFIDINLRDYNLAAEDLRKKKDSLSSVLVVHMFGHPADMDTISDVAGDIPVLEDCAQSLFSKYKGGFTGFLSTASFFSFRSGKYVSAGEGSAIFAKDRSLRNALKKLVEAFDGPSLLEEALHCTATYIKSTLYKRPWYGAIGYPVGTRIDRKLNLTAKTGFQVGKIARSDLEIVNDRMPTFFDKVNEQRDNALYLLKNLKPQKFALPRETETCWSNYYQFGIRFESKQQRDYVADYLFKHGIDSAKYLDEVVQVAREYHDYNGDCPNAEHCSKTVLVIPNHYTLSIRHIDHIVHCLNEASRHLKA